MKRISVFLIFIICFYLGCNKEKVKPTIIPEKVNTVFNKELPLEITSKKDNSSMKLIPYGSFAFGINKTERDSILQTLASLRLSIFDLEFSRQKEYLPSYYMDKFEITNKQYAKFLQETGHRKPRYWFNRLYNKPNQPVVGVSWEDADAYAKWAGKRLPSEEEWEKAARGTDGRIWPWGNIPDESKFNGKTEGNIAPVDVGSYPGGASPYGIMDMAGNVYEWTTGYWTGSDRAMRGGCYLNTSAYTRTMFRWATNQANGAEYLGFRCVADTAIVLNKN